MKYKITMILPMGLGHTFEIFDTRDDAINYASSFFKECIDEKLKKSNTFDLMSRLKIEELPNEIQINN